MVNAITLNPESYAAGEFPAVSAQVYVNDKLSDVFECLSVENTAGTVPGKAMLRFMPERLFGTNEADSPNTLKAYDNNIIPLFGSRISIVTSDATLFTGHLMRREDNGQSDVMMFTALDDREMLAKIPVRGAIVRDDYSSGGSVFLAKFLSRFETTCNPNGLWNCIGHTVDISGHPLDGEVVPIFSSRAQRRQNYESPDATFSTKMEEGVLVPWTPRRMLQYLWFVAHIGVTPGGIPDIQGLNRNSWRSLRNYPITGPSSPTVPESKYWDWPYTSLNITGSQPGTDTDDTAFPDPLDRKLPPMNFQGKALLQAIDDVLTTAGTHNFRVKPMPVLEFSDSDDENEEPYFQGQVKSTLEFFPIGYTANMGIDAQQRGLFGRDIPLMRGGKPSDLPNADTAYDFQLSEDITYTRNAVLVEGDVVRTETEISTGNALKPAWGTIAKAGFITEQDAFLQVIWGSTSDTDNSEQFARYPISQSLNSNDILPMSEENWQDADGKDGRQLAFARSPEAVQLARSLFPRVFRAFRIDAFDAETTDALDGAFDEYTDEKLYPKGLIARPVLSQQLQFQLADLEGGDGTENWLEEKFPIRVQVENDSEWQDVMYTEAQSLGDGVFMLDMAENLDTKKQCIYLGKLYDSGDIQQPDTLNVTLKNIKMNIAFPMDHRVAGFATSKQNDPDTYITQDFSSINAFYKGDTGGDGYLQYIDSPDGYREEHQVNSTPTAFSNMVKGGETTPIPLNRLLPPGSEDSNAQSAAERRLYGVQKIDRRSSWKMVGIRPVWEVGTWVRDIRMLGVNEFDYPIKAPILSIVHDFQGQVTTIGGLIGETF